MSSIGTGYDLAAATFSPDGRIFQVEYAQKAVDNGGTVLGVRCSDGVLLAAEKLVASKLHLSTSCPRVNNVSDQIGSACGGSYPDSAAMLSYARDHAVDYYDQNAQTVPISDLVHQTAMYAQIFTLGIDRPFGCSCFFGSWSKREGGHLYLVEPSGLSYEYMGWAVGKNRQAAKAEIEKIKFNEITVEEMKKLAAKIILSVRDEGKDKNMVIEMGCVSAASGGQFRQVPADQVAAAETWAKQAIEAEDDDEEDAMQQ